MKHLLLTTIAAVVLVGTAFAGPIHDAAKTGDHSGVQAELDKGVNVNAVIGTGTTPLHLACEKGQTETADLLITNGANITAKTMRGWTPLHFAVYRGHKQVLELLITNGATAKIEDVNGLVGYPGGMVQGLFTPLDLASRKNYTEIADLLRKNKGKSQGEWNSMPHLTYRDHKISIGRGILNSEYEVLFSSDLITWQLLGTLTFSNKHIQLYEDETSAEHPIRFYQLRLLE